MSKPCIVNCPLTSLELNVLLRSLATANDAERTNRFDRNVNNWLAERLLRLKLAQEEAPTREEVAAARLEGLETDARFNR